MGLDELEPSSLLLNDERDITPNFRVRLQFSNVSVASKAESQPSLLTEELKLPLASPGGRGAFRLTRRSRTRWTRPPVQHCSAK